MFYSLAWRWVPGNAWAQRVCLPCLAFQANRCLPISLAIIMVGFAPHPNLPGSHSASPEFRLWCLLLRFVSPRSGLFVSIGKATTVPS